MHVLEKEPSPVKEPSAHDGTAETPPVDGDEEEQNSGEYAPPTSLYQRSLQKRNFGYDVRVRTQQSGPAWMPGGSSRGSTNANAKKAVPTRRQGGRPGSPKTVHFHLKRLSNSYDSLFRSKI